MRIRFHELWIWEINPGLEDSSSILSFFSPFLLNLPFYRFILQHLFNWRLCFIIFLFAFYRIFHWFWKSLGLSSFFFIKGKIYIWSKNKQGWKTNKLIYKIYKRGNILLEHVSWQWLDEEPNQGQGAEPNT
jgi:hypothetical protein